MKYVLIASLSIFLISCGIAKYSLATKDGIIYSHIKSKEDCEKINDTFELHGLCIVE